jgi:hypothetical protein
MWALPASGGAGVLARAGGGPGRTRLAASPSRRPLRPDHLAPATPAAARRRRQAPPPAALASTDDENDGDDETDEPADVAAARARLVAGAALSPASTSISGPELRAAVREKYGRDYAVLLARRGHRVFFQILWKHLEQASYPQSEEDHAATYDAVASFLTEWGAGGAVRAAIAAGPRRGPGYTGGGAARAISIPLDVDLSSARPGEFF